MDPNPGAEAADDFTAWADARIAAALGDHLAFVERCRLAQVHAAVPPYTLPPEPEPEPLHLTIPERVWRVLIVQVGKQRLRELLAADPEGVYHWAWAAFRARLRAGEFGA